MSSTKLNVKRMHNHFPLFRCCLFLRYSRVSDVIFLCRFPHCLQTVECRMSKMVSKKYNSVFYNQRDDANWSIYIFRSILISYHYYAISGLQANFNLGSVSLSYKWPFQSTKSVIKYRFFVIDLICLIDVPISFLWVQFRLVQINWIIFMFAFSSFFLWCDAFKNMKISFNEIACARFISLFSALFSSTTIILICDLGITYSFIILLAFSHCPIQLFSMCMLRVERLTIFSPVYTVRKPFLDNNDELNITIHSMNWTNDRNLLVTVRAALRKIRKRNLNIQCRK